MIEFSIIFAGGLIVWGLKLGFAEVCKELKEGLKNIAIVIHAKK